MNYVDIKYIGGIDDKEAGASLTGSSTLLKSSKDVLGGNKVIIDFGMHQGSKNADLLNKEIPKELLDADFLVVTHAHMDHIGRIPQLVKEGFKGKIIMTPVTKDLALLMWEDYIKLTQKQQEKLIIGNKKKGQKLREYLKIVNSQDVSQDVSKELLNEAKEYLYILDIHNDNIAHIFSKKQAESLLSIHNRINKLEKLRENRKEKNIKEFSEILEETIFLLDGKEYSDEKLETNLYLLSLYPVEFNEYKSNTEDKNVLNILNLVSEKHNLAKKTKLLSKSEQEELNELNIKLKKIIGNKDLELCLIYANKILEKNSIDSCLNQNIPELLYDIDDVYKTLEQIETLEYGEEMNLDSRIVITKKDSKVIEKLLEIIEDGYNKKIYVLPQLKQYIINYFKQEYEKTLEKNEKNKKIKEEYLFLKKYFRKNKNLKLDNNEFGNDFLDNEVYEEKISNLEKEISKLKIIQIDGESFNLKYLLKLFNDNKQILENQKIFEKYKNYNLKNLENLNLETKKIVKKDILQNVEFSNNNGLNLDKINELNYNNFLGILNGEKIIVKRLYRKEFNNKLGDFISEYNQQIEKNIEQKQEKQSTIFIKIIQENMHIFSSITLEELIEIEDKIKKLSKELEKLKIEQKQFQDYKEKKEFKNFILNNNNIKKLEIKFNNINKLITKEYDDILKLEINSNIYDLSLLFNKNINNIYSYFENSNFADINLNYILKNVEFDNKKGIKNKKFLKNDFTKILNGKKIVINSNFKEDFRKQCNNFISNNNNEYKIYQDIKLLMKYFGHKNINQLIGLINKKKEEVHILEEKNKKLIEKRNILEYYINLNKLENNSIYLTKKYLRRVLENKKKVASEQRIYGDIKGITLEDNERENREVEGKILSLKNKKYGKFTVLELLDFYNKNINSYINRKSGKSKKEKLDSFYGDFNFFIKNKEIIELLFGEDKKNLEEILKIEEEIKVLQEKKLKLKNREEKIIARDKFLEKKEEFLREIKEVEEKYNIIINSGDDIENYIKSQFGKKILPYTKKQINRIISRLEPILEKENEKIVESLKIRFYKAGHIEGSAMASISYITKEVKSKVNGLLRRVDSFDGHKEIKKSHKNLLFSGDLGKFTEPNLSGIPENLDLKYYYVQLESTYSDRNHPDKLKEFERFINILNRPGKKLIAAFSLQRTQEILVELLNNKKNNLENIQKIKKLHNTKSKLKTKYNKLKSRENLGEDELQQKNKLFSQISSIEEDIEELSKGVFNGFIIQDSPLASKITKVFINHFPELYKILDPLIQKSVFGKEQIRELQFGEYKKLYEGKRAWGNDIIISSGGMLQGGAIINHIKNIISDERATLILTGYVAEGTLGRELLDIEKQLLKASGGAKKISIDGEEYDVKCKIESIGGYSSHMGKNDLIDFSGKQLNYSKNAKLALTHGDENREKLKEVIECINKKVDILVPKLGEKIKIIL